VDYLHRQKIIHRDLKPSNILITEGIKSRFVKLGDFGLAVNHYFEEQSHSQWTGTIKYMAPEVKNGRNYNMKADIYSLGVIIRELFQIEENMYEINTYPPFFLIFEFLVL
jgi:serine/threonine protein kinase